MIRPNHRRRFLATRTFAEAAVDIVAAHFGVTAQAIRGPRRCRAISRTRAVAAYVLRNATPFSYPEIGVMLGGKDHSAVMSMCRRIEMALEVDSVLRWDLLQIAQLLAERKQIRLSSDTGVDPAKLLSPT